MGMEDIVDQDQLTLDPNSSDTEIEEINKTLDSLTEAVPDEESEKEEELFSKQIEKDLNTGTKELDEEKERKEEIIIKEPTKEEGTIKEPTKEEGKIKEPTK